MTGPAVLAYHVEGGARWRTRGAWVRGWIGERPIDIVILRTGSYVWLGTAKLVGTRPARS